MTTTPFLTIKIAGKKDTVFARQRARRVASLLNFDVHEQACIAAGTFVIACQALMFFGKARLCFALENQQLQVFAQELAATPSHNRLAGHFAGTDPKALLRLAKALPHRELPAEELDLAWLVNEVETAACSGIFDEIIKQNQEILSFLHELRLFQQPSPVREENSPNPHAA